MTAPLTLRRLDSTAPEFDRELAALIAFEAAQDPAIDATVARIVADVRARGDAALLDYTAQFDRLQAPSVAALEISAVELRQAFDALPADQRTALETAAARIRAFHERQKIPAWTYRDDTGCDLGQQVTPLDRVGLYVPGGKAAYPSSVLMNAIPAHVAGVAEIVMVVPTPDGVRNPLVLAAAHLAGVGRVFTIGGAQAVAALAYGTATIPPVDKICGPGNAYVAAAKRRVFGAVGIDMVAGVSEILVIADATANPDWVAMDLFSQAEHDELAQAILLSPDAALLDAVAKSAQRQIVAMPRRAHHRRVVREPGCARPRTRPGRGLHRREPRRARAPGACRRRPGRAGAQDPSCRRDLHGPSRVGSARRLLCRAEPRAADRPHGAVFVAARRLRFPEAHEPAGRPGIRGARAGPGRGHPRATARACRRMRKAPGIA